MLSGCDTLSYYMQAFRGQAELWYVTRPITEVLADETAPADLKSRLANATRIRAFASERLSLPHNETYRGYADFLRCAISHARCCINNNGCYICMDGPRWIHFCLAESDSYCGGYLCCKSYQPGERLFFYDICKCY
jgi:hypothetical protein